MTHAVTRCPKCHTSFRVTAAQLDTAKGAVRCGSCLHVFDARSNFIQDFGKAAAPSSAPASAAAVALAAQRSDQPKAEPQSDHDSQSETRFGFDGDDFLISDDMDEPDETEGEDTIEDTFDLGDLSPEFSAQASEWESDNKSSLFDAPKSKPSDAEEDDEADDDTDESWAHALLDELNADPDQALPGEEDPADRLRREIDNRFDGRQTGSFDVLEEEWDADFDKFMSEAPIDDKPALDQDTGKFDLEDFRDTELGEAIFPERVVEREDRPEKYSFFHALEPEPLELTYDTGNGHAWLVRGGWILGNIVLFLALILQIGYLKFDTWSRVDPYRPWYALGCSVFGCTLPTRHDFSKIRISLVVRADPDKTATLKADAILINTAEFNQPFPPLALRFSDLNDQVVAERVFQPNEYLRGELAGAKEMPVGQPVQLNLELADPGEAAVNYRAYIPADG